MAEPSPAQTATIDRCATNLAIDLGLADQDLWLRHLWVATSTADEFVGAITSHIDLPKDAAFQVHRAFEMWGIEDGLQEFDDVLDQHEPVFTDRTIDEIRDAEMHDFQRAFLAMAL